MAATSGSTSKDSMLSINKAVCSIIDAYPTAAFLTDSNLLIVHANEHAGPIFGTRTGEVTGTSLIGLVRTLGFKAGTIDDQNPGSPEKSAIAREFIDRLQATLPYGLHVTSSEVTSVFDDGSPGQLFVIERQHSDPSDDELVVELDRMLTRGDMAAEIAHEMNNFLTILIGNTELIPMFIRNGDHQKAIDKLSVMKGTLGKIAGLSESLIEYGKKHNVRTINDLNEMIQSTLEFFSPQNRFDGIEICTNLAADLPPVRGDIGKLQQLIGNLIHNAADELKCASGDVKTMTITTHAGEESSSVVITVSDTGRGIDETVKGGIFHERCSTKPNGEGYGLLACKRIADDHGARISFDTVLGEGACFTVVIPAIAHPETETALPAENTAIRPANQ